jgi:hypothetical protein
VTERGYICFVITNIKGSKFLESKGLKLCIKAFGPKLIELKIVVTPFCLKYYFKDAVLTHIKIIDSIYWQNFQK